MQRAPHFAACVVLCCFLGYIKLAHASTSAGFLARRRSALRRRERKRAVPREIHSNYIRHISLRSRSRWLRAELGGLEGGNGGAARWRGGYGISGNRGVSKLTSSARAWPRTRSRRSAGVPPATGLRRADQWPAPAAAAFEALAAAQARVATSVKRRIFPKAFLAETF